MIAVEKHESVAVLKLSHGPTNPIGLELLGALLAEIRRVEEDPTLRGLVLTSASDKFFSIGFDIPQLYPLGREDTLRFYHAFGATTLALYTCPKPTIAAINGHAVAGGCILALCCDHRFIAEGHKLTGLNEVKLGVPVPHIADRITRALAGTRHAREILEGGEFYPPEDALRFGLVDQVLPQAELLPTAIAEAARLGALPPNAFTQIKHDRTEEIEGQVLARRDEKEKVFLDCWFGAEARAQLEEAMKRF